MLRQASILAILALLLAVIPVAASSPQPLGGTTTSYLVDPADQPIALPVGSSANMKLSESIRYEYSGDISGTGVIHREGMVFKDYTLRTTGTIICDPCTVRDPETGALRKGTLRIRQVNKGYIDFSVTPPVIHLATHDTILGGTGELASLRGQGTSWGTVEMFPGFTVPGKGGYTYKVHFDP